MRKLLLLSILMLFVFTSCDFFKSKKLFSDGEDTLLIQKRQDSLKFVDSIRSMKSEMGQIRKEHQQLLDSIKRAHAKKDQGHKYHIIVGGFRNPEYLNTYNTYIQEKGFNTKILENEYGFKLISVESYKNWSTAARSLENIRKDVEENAWIYIKG